MIRTGLVSITFRRFSPREIIHLVKKAGLNAIEWSGDIHVPNGDTLKAHEIYVMTVDAGISVASYGSYYKAGCEGNGSPPFEQVMNTALALQAPGIRVWAGNRSSSEADSKWFDKVIGDSRRIADIAQREGIRISFEYHSDSLTDTIDSTIMLLESINHKNVHVYWQPPVGLDTAQNIADLTRLLDWVSNIHVFNWNGYERLTLEEGHENWKKYINIIKSIEAERYCLIEFVKDDSSDAFLKDSGALKRLIL